MGGSGVCYDLKDRGEKKKGIRQILGSENDGFEESSCGER